MTTPPRPRGRPPQGRPRRQQVSLYLYAEELAAIDAARGAQDRNAWIRDTIAAALGLSTLPPRRPTPADAGTEGDER